MTTHYAEFMQKVEAGIQPKIYSFQPDDKPWFRLYDGNSPFSGNQYHHACVASRLSEDEATKAVELAKENPSAFADVYL